MQVIGQIIGTHGIKGELKVLALTDDLQIFESLSEIQIQGQKFTIESYREHKDWILIQVQGINSINEAERLSGYIEADVDEELQAHQFYIEDLKGLEVWDSQRLIGKVQDLISNGQTLLVIDLDEVFLPKRELLLPFVEEYIEEVSIQDSRIRVKLNDDILDLAS